MGKVREMELNFQTKEEELQTIEGELQRKTIVIEENERNVLRRSLNIEEFEK